MVGQTAQKRIKNVGFKHTGWGQRETIKLFFRSNDMMSKLYF